MKRLACTAGFPPSLSKGKCEHDLHAQSQRLQRQDSRFGIGSSRSPIYPNIGILIIMTVTPCHFFSSQAPSLPMLRFFAHRQTVAHPTRPHYANEKFGVIFTLFVILRSALAERGLWLLPVRALRDNHVCIRHQKFQERPLSRLRMGEWPPFLWELVRRSCAVAKTVMRHLSAIRGVLDLFCLLGGHGRAPFDSDYSGEDGASSSFFFAGASMLLVRTRNWRILLIRPEHIPTSL